MRVLAVLVLAVAGCAYVGAPASPSPTTQPSAAPTPPLTAQPTQTPEDRDAQRRTRAEAALQHWAEFMADKPADTLVFIWELTHGGGWRGPGSDDAKSAFLLGMIEATVDLPTDIPSPGRITWPGGTVQDVPLISAADALAAMIVELRGDQPAHECGDCLQVVGATMTTRQAVTWRGEAEVPVWQFEFSARDEPIEPISYVAVRDRVAFNDWDSWPDFHPSTGGAYGQPDDTEITVGFSAGACYSGPWFAEAVESDLAVVVIISALPPDPDASPRPCTAQAVGYSVRAQLNAPLGDRAVLDIDSGFPVPVYPEIPPGWAEP